MQNYTDRLCGQLRMPEEARQAAEDAYATVVCARRWLLFPRHTDEERVFLRLMLRLALARDPSLAGRAGELADYLGGNYAFEWVNGQLTATVRTEARERIIALGAESGHDPGLAGALAFVWSHHQSLGHSGIADYASCYDLACTLERQGKFEDAYPDWREELGLPDPSAARDQ